MERFASNLESCSSATLETKSVKQYRNQNRKNTSVNRNLRTSMESKANDIEYTYEGGIIGDLRKASVICAFNLERIILKGETMSQV